MRGMSRIPPIEFSLDIKASLYKEGKWWVAEVPALSMATQGQRV